MATLTTLATNIQSDQEWLGLGLRVRVRVGLEIWSNHIFGAGAVDAVFRNTPPSVLVYEVVTLGARVTFISLTLQLCFGLFLRWTLDGWGLCLNRQEIWANAHEMRKSLNSSCLRVILVYLYPFHCNSLFWSQKSSKKIKKLIFLEFQVIWVHRCWHF